MLRVSSFSTNSLLKQSPSLFNLQFRELLFRKISMIKIDDYDNDIMNLS